MARLDRVVVNILVSDLATSVAFYERLGGFEPVEREAGRLGDGYQWQAILSQPGAPQVQLGLIDKMSEFAPRHAWGSAAGSFLTFKVGDVFDAVEAARGLGAEIVEMPTALATGWTRALIRDPNGYVIELTTPTAALGMRENMRVQGLDRSVAIDQDQPEDAPLPMGPPA
jgi:catechol 2,3-dioxygenase-like lactoylglutathione lyase family enzyme